MIFRLAVVTSLLLCVASYSTFQKSIPNGDIVPLPCKSGQLWPGVGHFLNAGTGARNPFGADFQAAGKTWTKELCQKDSDGDGRTNGAELGDPECVWKEGDTPKSKENLSHPGICEPITNTTCQQKKVTWGQYTTQQQWLAQVCKTEGFQCPALQEPGVQNITARLPPGTKIPAKETTYECQIFDLTALGVPDGQTFHMVAVTPIIDNSKVLHHMVLSGCEGDVQASTGPYSCGMLASDKCMQFLHVWTVGLDGECYHPESGVKIGKGGYKFVAIQLHWNNPGVASDLTDSSGMVLHYTPNLRTHDAGVLMIGSNSFHLPPKQEVVTIHSTCASGCTHNDMRGPIHVTFAWNHMHYAGRKMHISIVRDGTFLRNLTNDESYSYDSPEVNLYPDPIVIVPGDALEITCQFNTMSKNKTVFYGEATQDEMCYGFLTYFPLQNYTRPFCTDVLGVSYCNPASWGQCKIHPELFAQQIYNSTMYLEVFQNCRYFTPCNPECVDTLVKYFKTEPCMQGNVWEYVEDYLATSMIPTNHMFLGYVASCKSEVYLALNPAPGKGESGQGCNDVSTRGQALQDSNSGLGIRAATGSLSILALGVIVAWISS